MARYLGRVKVDKVDAKGNKIHNLGKWLKTHPNEIYFDSNLEYLCYNYLNSKGINFEFHPEKIVYLESFYVDTFVPSKTSKKEVKSKNIKKGDTIPGKIKRQKVQEASYTADFLIKYKQKFYYIETKGFADEAFKLRFKYFRSQLNKNQHAFVVKSLKEFKELLNLIYENEK